MKKIEKIQKRALQFIYDDHISSYPELRSKANKPLLCVHRIRLLVLEIYKIIHSIGPKYLDDMFTIKNTTYNMRDNMKLIVPKTQNC